MSLFAPRRLRIEKEIIVRLTRSLKGSGKIIVSVGQEVTPADILGTAFVSAGFRNINLAQLLEVGPDTVTKYLKRTVGQRIYKGELLAEKSGFLQGKRQVLAPTDGILDYLDPKSGELHLKFLPKKEELPSGVFGIVEAVDPNRGQVLIRTQVSLVYGMFGTGRIRDGVLHLITKRDDFLQKKAISAESADHILVAGSLIFKEVISSAISAGVSGIITGGINAKDYQGMSGGRIKFPKKTENDVGISIVVCEGFGSIPIGSDIYETLSVFNDRFISIDGNKGLIYLPAYQSQSLIKIRATHLPPIQETTNIRYVEDTNLEDINLGQMVRIIGNSYPGDQGKIIAIDQAETLLPSGLRAFLATVETKRSRLKVPVANLEIIM